jgi:hypothetical protein
MEQKIKTYLNGDFEVSFLNLGSRVIKPVDPDKKDGKFEFPNAMDICITKYCDNGCSFCYNNSTISGKHCDVNLFKEVVGTYKGGEIAIGGGDAFTHPNITEILEFCKERGIFVSLTVNQNHLKRHKDQILDYFSKDLMKSIGISMTNPSTWNEDLYQEISQAKEEGTVIHVIAGILDDTYFKALTGKKILILGYKDLGRGKGKIPTGYIEWLKEEWLETLRYKCPVIIFDNLAIEQLSIDSKFSPEEWGMIYQGDDGNGTMYIDLVDGWFGKSSIVGGKERLPLTSTDVDELYQILQQQ